VRRSILALSAAAVLVAALARPVSTPAGAEDDPSGRPLPRAVLVQRLAERAAALEAERESARGAGLEIRGRSPDGGLFELISFTGRVPLYVADFNEDAARSTRTDSVLALFPEAGAGETVGLWDGDACRVTHQEIVGRAEWRDGSYIPGDHATHVAGTLIASGVRAGARGMAPAASLISYEWNFDELEAELEAQAGLLLSNHSYGHVRGWTVLGSGTDYWFGDVTISETEDYLFGFYSDASRDWDEVCERNPYYLPVTSAGNDRNDAVEPGAQHYYWDEGAGGWVLSTAVRDNDGAPDGYDCIPDGQSIAKNVLTIGAVEDVPPLGGPDSVRMTYFSSWGPADDGRIKPDICGNGWDVFSALASSDVAYGWGSGTSMASPNVCGSLVLLQARFRELRGSPMRAATLKALALHTAREAGPAPGPDYMFGWGLLDALAAFELIGSDPDGRMGLISEFTLYDGRAAEFWYEPDGSADRLAATICWTDPAAEVPEPAVDPREPLLVDDLDLRISKDGIEWLPWTLDPDDPAAPAVPGDNIRDNVEQVVVDQPSSGPYLVRISNKGTLADGSRRFALIVSGGHLVRTWHVFADGSGDVPKIKDAVHLASPGDQIFVFPGMYYEFGIVIDKELLLRGVEGAEETVINAYESGRCLIVRGASAQIEGLTFRNGIASGSGTDGRGGGVFVDGADASISSCVIRDCRAEEAGGGLYARNGRPDLTDCLIWNNTARERGGGICLHDADAAIERTGVGLNLAGSGGGIWSDGSSPEIISSTFAYNRNGNVLLTGDGAPRIERSIVAFGFGGEGIRAEGIGIRLSIECCDVYGNTDGDYSGMPDQEGRNGNFSADPVFCNLTGVIGNLDLGDGSPCQPQRNDCGVLIGAYGTGCHTLRTMRVAPDGTGDAPTIADALERAQPGDTILLLPGTFSGLGNRDINVPVAPLVITSQAGAEQTVIDCSGSDEYYGFYFSGAHDTNTVVEGVTVTHAEKGGVACYDGSKPLVQRCVITDNDYLGGWHGGGIICEANSAPLVRDCVISDNTGDPHGGGVYCRSSSPRLVRCTITGNTAIQDGGGVTSMNSSHPVLEGCTIEGNTAGSEGGGVFAIMGSASLEDCFVIGNTAQDGGGGVFSGTNGVLSILGTVVAGNDGGPLGGGVYSAMNMTMTRCTIVGNRAASYGAGIECLYGTQNSVRESIIAFNRERQGVYTVIGTLNIRCCDVYGNEGGEYGGSTADQTGTYNISADPLFCDPGAGDYHLAATSPVLSPPHTSCGASMGALGVRCGDAPDLLFSRIEFGAVRAPAGTAIGVTAVVRNGGTQPAPGFTVHCAADPDLPLVPDQTWWTLTVGDGLAAGDSVVWEFDITSPEPAVWESYLSIDPEHLVPELDRDNNVEGPLTVTWTDRDEARGSTYLGDIRPNPFSETVRIEYGLGRHVSARIEIYDLAGRMVKVWKLPAAGPGEYAVEWDGRGEWDRDLAPGVYFCRFTAGGVERSAKIVLMR
jgi:parallel beta-helix repeat protein